MFKYLAIFVITLVITGHTSSHQPVNAQIPGPTLITPGPYYPGFSLASPGNWRSPAYPNAGFNLNLKGIPRWVPKFSMTYFPITLDMPPGWTNGNIVITDRSGAVLPYLTWIPTNHTAEIYVFVGAYDFEIDITIDFNGRVFHQIFQVRAI